MGSSQPMAIALVRNTTAIVIEQQMFDWPIFQYSLTIIENPSSLEFGRRTAFPESIDLVFSFVYSLIVNSSFVWLVDFQGAFWALMVGFVIGVVRMILDFVYTEPGCGEEDHRPLLLVRIHYMYFAMILFGVTGLTMVLISCCSKPPEPSKVSLLSYCHVWLMLENSVIYCQINLRILHCGHILSDCFNRQML